ncbi:MAG: hypothetical protein AAF799_05710 [Myxococcota bacterium]
MRTSLQSPMAVIAASLALAACQTSEDEIQFRSTYTTNVTLDGGDDGGPNCEPTEFFDVNERRSLFETHELALSAFQMDEVLDAIAVNGGLTSNPGQTHDQLMDTYNPSPGLGLGGNCDDEVDFNGDPGLNGYPLQCGRAEGDQIGNMDEWFPIAVVNRFDLAPSDGSNCGEARIVMANVRQQFPNRFFTIFEAQVPNPDPSCGIDACAPVQEFWASLTDIDDPVERGEQLRMAFLDGHPDLEAAGFPPFVRHQAFTFGAGQVRTNNFHEFPWTLREFKTVAVKPQPSIGPVAKGGAFEPAPSPGLLRMVQVPVAANPFGELWDDTAMLPQSKKCLDALVATVPSLMSDNPNLMGVSVPTECLAAESPDTSAMDYPNHLNPGGPLANAIQNAIFAEDPMSSLQPVHIARRALFAGGCIGCHQRSNFGSNNDLGNGVNAPVSLGFVHTSEFAQEDCGDGDSSCFVISSALKDSFLPHRKSVMDTFLNDGPCCEPNDVDIGVDPGPIPLPEPVPLPIEEAEIDVEQMLEAEADAVAAQSPVTVSGTSTKRAH